MSKYSTYVQGYIKRHGLSGGELPVASGQPSFQEYYDYPWDNIPNIGMVSAQPITNSNPFDKFTFSGITSPAIFKYSINGGPWSYFHYTATAQSKLVVELKENAKNVIRFLTFDWGKFRFPRPENALVVNITHDQDWDDSVYVYDMQPILPTRTPSTTIFTRLAALQTRYETIKTQVENEPWVEHTSVSPDTFIPITLPASGENTVRFLRRDEGAAKYPNEKFAQSTTVDYDPLMDISGVMTPVMPNNLSSIINDMNYEWVVQSESNGMLQYRVNNEAWQGPFPLKTGENMFNLAFDPGKNTFEYLTFDNALGLWPPVANAQKIETTWKMFDLQMLIPTVTNEQKPMVGFQGLTTPVNIRYHLNASAIWTTLEGVTNDTLMTLDLEPGLNTLYVLVQDKDGITWPDTRFALEFQVTYDATLDTSNVANVIKDGSVNCPAITRVPDIEYVINTPNKIVYKLRYVDNETGSIVWTEPRIAHEGDTVENLIMTYGSNVVGLLVWNTDMCLWPQDSKAIETTCEFEIPYLDPQYPAITADAYAYVRFAGITASKTEDLNISINGAPWIECPLISNSTLIRLDSLVAGENTIRVLLKDKTSGTYPPVAFATSNSFEITSDSTFVPEPPVQNTEITDSTCVGAPDDDKAVWTIPPISMVNDSLIKYKIDEGVWRGPVVQKAGQELSISVDGVSNGSTLSYIVYNQETMLWPYETAAGTVTVELVADFVRVIQDTFAPPKTGIKVLYCKDDIYPYAMSVGQPAYSELTEDVIINACGTAG